MLHQSRHLDTALELVAASAAQKHDTAVSPPVAWSLLRVSLFTNFFLIVCDASIKRFAAIGYSVQAVLFIQAM
jgi:hypothetical protein